MKIKINPTRVQDRLEALAQFGRAETGGWSRFCYTPEYRKARDLVKEWMEEAGMTTRIDAVGNLIGRAQGTDGSLPVVAAGSHIDTVKNGGKFDGNLGVIGALEVAQTIRENRIAHRYPLEVIVFAEEEGSRFGSGLFGSRGIAGELDSKALHQIKDKDGVTVAEILRSAGLDPAKVAEARVAPGYYKAYFELHIEQGAVLDSLGIGVGVVEGIAAPCWLQGVVRGRADHAGATPMDLRKDALTAAAEIVLATERIAREIGQSTVATVGILNVLPGGSNIIPGQVDMTFDVRNIHVELREKAIEEIKTAAGEISRSRNVSWQMEEVMKVDSCVLPAHMTKLIEDAAVELGVPYHRMISGSGHDAQLMAKLTDVAMVFAPSKEGLSHCPEEWTEMEDIAACTQVLLQAMLKVM